MIPSDDLKDSLAPSLAERTRRLGRNDVAPNAAYVLYWMRDSTPKVAVIGAGISGLICARTLSDHGCDVSVYEKSRGVCGDWCAGARVEGAFLSGMAISGRILGAYPG